MAFPVPPRPPHEGGPVNPLAYVPKPGQPISKDMTDQWLRLPADVIRVIFARLSPQDLVSLARTRRVFRQIITSDAQLAPRLAEAQHMNKLRSQVAIKLRKEIMPRTLTWTYEYKKQSDLFGIQERVYGSDSPEPAEHEIKLTTGKDGQPRIALRETEFGSEVKGTIVGNIAVTYTEKIVKKPGLFSSTGVKERTVESLVLTLNDGIDPTVKQVLTDEVNKLNNEITQQHNIQQQAVASIKAAKGKPKFKGPSSP